MSEMKLGYVRCGTHLKAEWQLEEQDGQPRSAILRVETQDGKLEFLLDLQIARSLRDCLNRFLGEPGS